MKEEKITLALLWSRYDGKVTSVNDLALRLDKERFNVLFIFLNGDAGEKNSLREAGHKVLFLSDVKKVNAFRFSVLSRLVKILREQKIDMLHCHAHKATVYGAMAAALAGTPVVLAHVHGLGRSRNLRRKLMNFLLFRRIDRLICVANRVRQDVLKSNWRLPAGKTAILENSVEYERFADVSVSKANAKQMLGLQEDAFVFGTVGRLAPTKGLSYLIEAFGKVKKQKPSAHLVLLGDGPCRAELQQQVSSISCTDSVHFLGYRSNIEQLIRGMDVFVLSSVAEGMPRAILEVMAAGIPCIATAVGGIPEILDTPGTGRLVPPADANALAEAMKALACASPHELQALVEKAKQRIRTTFSHDVIKKKLESIYEMEMNRYYESNRRQKSHV